jgi:hypothetical protein
MFFTPLSTITAMGQVGGLYFFGFAALILFAVWVVTSFVIYVAGRALMQGAAIQRDVLEDFAKTLMYGGLLAHAQVRETVGNVELKQGAHPAPVTPAQESDVWDNPPTKITCDDCKRPHAMLYCSQHSKFMCFPCTARHDTEGCSYIAAGRELNKGRKQPVTAKPVGKVLGL